MKLINNVCYQKGKITAITEKLTADSYLKVQLRDSSPAQEE